MFTRKLRALGFPIVTEADVKDVSQLQKLVLSLENLKICHYKIVDRKDLQDFSNVDKWRQTFSKYLQDLQCPYTDLSNTTVIVDWLLSLAVRLSYSDNAEKYRKCRPDSKRLSNGSAASGNPLTSLDFDDPAMIAGITSVAALLQVPPHHDHKEVLKAVCLLVQETLSVEALQSTAKQTSPTQDKLSLDTLDLGFSTGDYVTEEAVKILRLLHIRNLRELQNQINETLVKVQIMTANPKTDQRLGKIGR